MASRYEASNYVKVKGYRVNVEHQPVANREACVLLFEPAATVNTGNVRNERTIETIEPL